MAHDDLAVRAQTLAEQTAELTRAVAGLDARANRSGRVLLLAVLGVVLDLVLSVVVVATLLAQHSTDTELQTEIDRQAQIREDSLCPLYRLISQSQSPAGRDRYPQGPDAYDAAFVKLNAAFAVLSCPP